MNQNYQYFMKENVAKYIGEWIAICDKKVVAHGRDVKRVFNETKEKYPKKRALIIRVPDKETMIF